MQTTDSTIETLREQYKSLKKAASSHCKVSQEMIEKATKSHVSVINRTKSKIILCGIFGLFLWPFVSRQLGLSMLFTIVTMLFLIWEIGFKWWNLKDITDPTDCSANLMELADRSLRAKRRLLVELYTGTVALVLWFIYFCYELWQHLDHNEAKGMIIVCTISGIVGFLIGLSYSRRIRSELSRIHLEITDVLSTEKEE